MKAAISIVGTGLARNHTVHVFPREAGAMLRLNDDDIELTPSAARDLARVLLSLVGESRSATSKAAKADLIRIERGDYVRASGNVTCDVCGCLYFDHAGVAGFEWLTRACDGRLLKL